jgi:hypothetical protein
MRAQGIVAFDRPYDKEEYASTLEAALHRPEKIKILEMERPEDSLLPRIHELVNLERLIFGNYGYNSRPNFPFPKEFCALPKLREIEIIRYEGVFPGEIAKLKSLRKFTCLPDFSDTVPLPLSGNENLEEINGHLPLLPWTGNFKGLKKLSSPSIQAAQLIKLTALEELKIIFDVDKSGNFADAKQLEALANLKMLRKLELSTGGREKGDGGLRNTEIDYLFYFLDQLPLLKELKLSIETFDGGTNKFRHPSSALKKITSLELDPVLDLDFVMPEKFDSLSIFKIHFNSTTQVLEPERMWQLGSMFIPEKRKVVSSDPGALLKRFPPLKKVEIIIFDYDLSKTLPEAWFNAFGNDKNQKQIDSLFIVFPQTSEYEKFYEMPFEDFPSFQKPVLSILAGQQKLKHLSILGIAFDEPVSFTDTLAGISTLTSVNIELLILNGASFPMKHLSKYQQFNWVLLRDDFSTNKCGQYAKNKIPHFWKIISPGIIYENYFKQVYGNERNPPLEWPHYTGQSALPVGDTLDDLPLVVPLFYFDYYSGVRYPVIVWPNRESINGYQFSTIEWIKDVREYYYWEISDEQFKKGTMDTSKDDYTEKVEWYSDGSLKSLKELHKNKREEEERWTENGVLTYQLINSEHNYYAKYDRYEELAWDDAGTLLWARVGRDSTGRIVEMHFYPNGHLQSEGWTYKKRKVGKWYYFDEEGNQK